MELLSHTRRDRTDYRRMATGTLLSEARECGMDEELAIAIAERLAKTTSYSRHGEGHFHFKPEKKEN